MNRVLVTGASGFVGYQCLAPLSARGYDVHALQSRGAEVSHPDVTWHCADLLDTESTRRVMEAVRPTHLLHLAWNVEPGKMFEDPSNATWLQRGIDLLRLFEEFGGKRMTVGGSCYEYDWNYGFCSEERTPTKPNTFYGVCKNSLHEVMRHYCRGAGLSYAWGRIFFLYGPREKPQRLVSSVIRNVLQGKPAPCSGGEQVRDYMSVEDLGDALAALLDSEFEGPCNTASGEPVKLKTIVTRIGELAGRPDLIQLGALPARANDRPLVVANPTRLRDEIGWTPKLDLESGLRRTIDWWREELSAS